MKFHVILACHNRRDVTIAGLDALMASAQRAAVACTVTLFDDGSADGTAELVKAHFPEVKIVRGEGSAYWAKSMAAAEAEVVQSNLQRNGEEFVVWLNDDVRLDVGAFERIIPVLRRHQGSVVVGAVRGAEGGEISYSGLRKRGLHPLGVQSVRPTTSDQSVDTFNGNFVFVPSNVLDSVGYIDGGYAHAFADIDYGFRCGRAGVQVWLAPGTFGRCPSNPAPPQESIGRRWARFTSIKGGGHPTSVMRILRKIAPTSWPAFMLMTYFLWWLRQAAREVRRAIR